MYIVLNMCRMHAMETLRRPFLKILGDWMDSKTKKNGERMYLILKSTVAGVMKRGKLAYLVGESVERKGIEKMNIGRVIAVLRTVNGHLDGDQKTKTRTHELKEKLTLRRRISMLKSNHLQVAVVLLLNQIHVTNGGHAIVRRFILVGHQFIARRLGLV